MHTFLKAGLVLAVAGAAAAQATETARVVNRIAMQEQVSVPRRVCQDQVVTTPGQKSGAGAAIGAVAGGVVGNQVGHGSGRAAATALGVVGGALLGNSIEAPGAARSDVVQNCTTQNVVETRVRGYQVTYEYAGKTYQVEMPYDPGDTLAVQVTPVIGGMPPPAPAQTVRYGAPAPLPHANPGYPIGR